MEENKVENVINIIKGMDIKDKLRLGICLTTSDWANILYNKTRVSSLVSFFSSLLWSGSPLFLLHFFQMQYQYNIIS